MCVCYYQCAYQVNCVARTATMLKINPRLSIDDLEALFELFVSILITYYYTRHIIVVVVGGVVSVAAAVVVLFCLLKTNVAFIVFFNFISFLHYGNYRCTLSRCTRNVLGCENFRSHKSHSNGFAPVCIELMCNLQS